MYKRANKALDRSSTRLVFNATWYSHDSFPTHLMSHCALPLIGLFEILLPLGLGHYQKDLCFLISVLKYIYSASTNGIQSCSAGKRCVIFLMFILRLRLYLKRRSTRLLLTCIGSLLEDAFTFFACRLFWLHPSPSLLSAGCRCYTQSEENKWHSIMLCREALRHFFDVYFETTTVSKETEYKATAYVYRELIGRCLHFFCLSSVLAPPLPLSLVGRL
jgi:hypothetical protein